MVAIYVHSMLPYAQVVLPSCRQVERPIDANELTRHASVCAVPEGKIGSYGHRALMAIMLGCVPLITKAITITITTTSSAPAQ